MGKILFLDLSSGVSGDMFAGALYGLLGEKEKADFQKTVNAAGLPGVRIEPEKVKRSGISSVKMHVRIDGAEEGHGDSAEGNFPENRHAGHWQEKMHSAAAGHTHNHHGHSVADIEAAIDALHLETDVKKSMKEIYSSIAQAEGAVHGIPVTDIHFHEVGTWDAIADVMNACVLMKMLKPDVVCATSVNVGNGTVHCAHGILPVPAPAAAELLKGIPIRRTPEENAVGELATPTGAALVKYFVTAFGPGPEMTISVSGFGAGEKELPEQANVLHAILGKAAEAENPSAACDLQAAMAAQSSAAAAGDADNTSSAICELVFNVDDMTGEDLSFACDCLRDGGATEAYFTPVFMKKGRPGYQVTVLCPNEAREEIIRLVFLHTTTVGLREYETRRAVLTRHYEKRHTSYGDVTVKVSEGYGVHKEKPEYEDLAAIAAEQDMGIRELREALRKEL